MNSYYKDFIFTFIHQKAGRNNRKAKKTTHEKIKHWNMVQRLHKVLQISSLFTT